MGNQIMKCFEQSMSGEKRFNNVLENIVKSKMSVQNKVTVIEKLIADYESGLFE